MACCCIDSRLQSRPAGTFTLLLTVSSPGGGVFKAPLLFEEDNTIRANLQKFYVRKPRQTRP